jgi:hypothetical protein
LAHHPQRIRGWYSTEGSICYPLLHLLLSFFCNKAVVELKDVWTNGVAGIATQKVLHIFGIQTPIYIEKGLGIILRTRCVSGKQCHEVGERILWVLHYTD